MSIANIVNIHQTSYCMVMRKRKGSLVWWFLFVMSLRSWIKSFCHFFEFWIHFLMFYVWFEKMKLCCYVLLHFSCLPSFFYCIYCTYHCSFVTMGLNFCCVMLWVHAIAPTTIWPLLCPIWEKESWFFCFATLLTHAIIFLLQFLCLQLFGLYYVGFKKGESDFFLLWCVVDTYNHSFFP